MGTENRNISSEHRLDVKQADRLAQVSGYLVSYGVGARDGAGDVVESVGHGGVLNDVTGVDDVRASGRDLNLDLVPHTGGARQQAHPSQQLSDVLRGLAEGNRPALRYERESRRNARVLLDSLNADFLIDQLSGKLLFPVSQLLKYKPGTLEGGRQKTQTIVLGMERPQYWIFGDLAIWRHHLSLLHPERARDRRSVTIKPFITAMGEL